jgi:hypothetical protein
VASESSSTSETVAAQGPCAPSRTIIPTRWPHPGLVAEIVRNYVANNSVAVAQLGELIS